MEITSKMIIKADGTTGQNINKGTGIKTPHIQDGAVTRPKIRNGSISSSIIREADGTTGQDANKGWGIKTPHIQDGAVTTAKIKDEAVTEDRIANAAVTEKKLAENVKGKLVTKGDSHTHSAADIGALPITGGTVNGNLSVNGKVGVGVTEPKAKMDVRGDIVSSGRITCQNSRVIATADDTIETQSNEWIDMPDMSVNLTTGNNILLILFMTGGIYLYGPKKERAHFRLVVDNQPKCYTSPQVYNNGWEVTDAALHWMGAITAGEHNIKVQWFSNNENGLTCCRGSNTRSLIAVEL